MSQKPNPLLQKLILLGLVTAVGVSQGDEAAAQARSGSAPAGVDYSTAMEGIMGKVAFLQAHPRGVMARRVARQLARELQALPPPARSRAFRDIIDAGGLPQNIANGIGLGGTPVASTASTIY